MKYHSCVYFPLLSPSETNEFQKRLIRVENVMSPSESTELNKFNFHPAEAKGVT